MRSPSNKEVRILSNRQRSLLVLALMGALPLMAPSAEAISISSLEVGGKVPLAALASVQLDEHIRLEVSAVIPGFSAPLVDFEGMLAVKLYPGPLELGGLTWRPFIGGGPRFLYAVDEMVPGLAVLVGMEHATAELPLTVFAEGSGTWLTNTSAPTLVFQVSLGARYEWRP
jgi:hypothetical protein